MLSFDEAQERDLLCVHCPCTSFGEDMSLRNCNEQYCDDAYSNYVACNAPNTFEDMEGTDELCEHCRCTGYGEEMKAKELTIFSPGCEGSYCRDAYDKYLEDEE